MKLFGFELNRIKEPQVELLGKDSSAIRAIVIDNNGQPNFTKRNYKELAVEGFEWNITVYACVTLIMDDIAGIKWKLASRRGNRITPILDHPLLDLLMKPNSTQQYTDFIKSYVGFDLCSGNVYVEASGIPNKPEDPGSMLKKPPIMMNVLRPDRMTVLPAKFGGDLVGGYQYEVGHSKVIYDPSRILHVKKFHPTNDFYGFSPLEAAAVTVDTDNASRKWNMYLLQNHAKPSGVLFVQGSMSADDRQVLERKLASRHQGIENTGRPLILEKNDKNEWKQMSMSPVDMDWGSGQKMNKVDICTAYKVPPELLGDSQSKTFNSYKEAKKSYFYQGILPRLDDIKNGWNTWLTPWFGDNLFLDYDRDDIEAIQDDRQTVIDMATGLYSEGLATANEARTLMGFPNVNDDFGDVRLISFQDMPINELGDPDDFQNGPSTIDSSTMKQRHGFQTKQGVYYFKKPPSLMPVKMFKQKCFNLKTKEARQTYARSLDAYKKAWERKLASTFTKELKADYKEIANSIRKSVTIDHARVLIMHMNHVTAPSWRKLLIQQYRQIIPDFGRRTIKEIVSDTKDDGLSWMEYVQDYIDQFGAQKVDSISDTTKQDIRDILDEGYINGNSVGDIANAIEDASDGLDGRGMTIARTELGGAANYGSFMGASSTGLDLEKGWLAVEDDRTRPDHSDVDGTFVAMGDSFDVGGGPMDYPGDPSGGPDETINCRCTIIYQQANEGTA